MISRPSVTRFALTLLLGASFAACSGDDTVTGSSNGTTPEPPGLNEVHVLDNSFNPTPRTVPAGTTVQWTWRGGNSHNVTFGGGMGNSVTQTSGTYMQLFAAPGTFSYECTIHVSLGMTGTIVVQ